ncbi:hypothetical protein GCM10010417_54450 [Streptomyces carpaticus]
MRPLWPPGQEDPEPAALSEGTHSSPLGPAVAAAGPGSVAAGAARDIYSHSPVTHHRYGRPQQPRHLLPGGRTHHQSHPTPS